MAIELTDPKGDLVGALVVRDHHELMLNREGVMVQRTAAADVCRQGRTATGVRVMNLHEDDVSAIALVVDTGENGDDEPEGIELQGEPGEPAELLDEPDAEPDEEQEPTS